MRPMKDSKKKYKAPDGVWCKRHMQAEGKGYCGLAASEREGFEMDPKLYRKRNPKYVRLRDGTRVRYDPNKHY
jgi:hypothetical protein